MANIAKLKVKMIMETEEYMRATEKVIQKTESMGDQIDRITKRVAKSYAKSMQDGFLAAFGAQAIDQGLRDLAKTLDTFTGSTGKNLSSWASNASDQFDRFIKTIPLLGGAIEALQSTYYALERTVGSNWMNGEDPFIERIQEHDINQRKTFGNSTRPAVKSLEELKFQTQLLQAASEDERRMLQYEHERAEIMERLRGVYEGPERDRLQAELEAAIKINQLERERAAARKEEELRAKKAAEDAERRAQERAKAEERREQETESFMEDLEESLRRQTMTEREQFEYRLAQVDLDEAQVKRAREIFELTHQAKRLEATSAVTGVSTAVGSIRMAGSVDYTQQRMAGNLDSIRDSSKAVEENTRWLASSMRAA